LQLQVWFSFSSGKLCPGRSSGLQTSQAEGEGKNPIPKEI